MNLFSLIFHLLVFSLYFLRNFLKIIFQHFFEMFISAFGFLFSKTHSYYLRDHFLKSRILSYFIYALSFLSENINSFVHCCHLAQTDSHVVVFVPQVSGDPWLTQYSACIEELSFLGCIKSVTTCPPAFQRPKFYHYQKRRDSFKIFFNVTALQRYNSYTSHPFEVYNSMVFSIFSELCNHHHNKFQNIFITPKINPIPFSSHFPFSLCPSSPWQLLIYFFSLWIFHINGIIQDVVFCVFLLSLSIIFKVHSCCSIYQCFIPFFS